MNDSGFGDDILGTVRELQQMVPDIGEAIWRGVTIPCLPVPREEGVHETLGPLVEDNRMSFIIAKEDIKTATGDSSDPLSKGSTGDNNMVWPSQGHVINWRNVAWMIDKTSGWDSSGAYMRVDCVSPDS